MTEHVENAIESFAEDREEPMGLDEFVERVVEEPRLARSSAEYVLDAIEYYGTRDVVEHGIEYERYRFFDDPENDGEHAVIGHTRLLNSFVEDLRQQACGDANEESIFWFNGPTATGKSELKRCLINGIEAYSKTDEGARYTVEWNTEVSDSGSPMTWAEGSQSAKDVDDVKWFQSPVQSNPLSVLPESVRRDVLEASGVNNTDYLREIGSDPFSDEAVEILEQKYGHGPDAYESIFSAEHCRVVRYRAGIGQGIGVLQSEDGGQPKQKLVGQWMQGMVKELDSRGRRNPQAFAYDGVLSQGNTGLSVVEDATNHFEMLTKMLNVVDDNEAKIDRRSRMPIDTVYMLISNPGLQEHLNDSHGNQDPLRAIRRRLARYDLGYLITYSNEAELLVRLLTDQTEVWTDGENVGRSLDVDGTELAPHTIESVAMYEVLTRMEEETGTKIDEISLIDRAKLYDDGHVEVGGHLFEIEKSNGSDVQTSDGSSGIPCTYTRNVLADLIAEEDVILPSDAIDAVAENVSNAPVFNDDQVDVNQALSLSDDAKIFVFERQESDVLDAMLRDHTPTEDEVEEYIEHVYSWGTEEETVDPDPMTMKVFEQNYLGFTDEEYDGSDPSDDVETYRRDEIITGISTWIYEQSDEYEVDLEDVPVSEIPVLADALEENSWADVERIYEDFKFTQWADPLEGTQTEEVKEMTIQNMQEMFGYSEESARRTAASVVDELTGPELSLTGGE